jgi:hypothetical protein
MKIPMRFPEKETEAFIDARSALIVALRDTPKEERGGRPRYTWAEIGEEIGCSAGIAEDSYKERRRKKDVQAPAEESEEAEAATEPTSSPA